MYKTEAEVDDGGGGLKVKSNGGRERTDAVHRMRSRPLATILFLLVLMISLVLAIMQHRRQFHEVDSFAIVGAMMDPVGNAIGYVGYSYVPQVWSGGVATPAPKPASDKLALLIPSAPDWMLRDAAKTSRFQVEYGKTHSGAIVDDPSVIRTFLLERIHNDQRLATLPLHGIYRLGLIGAVMAMPLPQWLRAGIMLPLGSTYSLGPGIAYGMLYALSADPIDFLRKATLMTLLLFHATAAALFITLRRFGIGSPASAAVSIWFLLSTSLFSYGLHLGSTVWMVAGSTAFLLALASGWSPRKMSLAAGALIFFNYLIVLHYGAYLLIDARRRWREIAGVRTPVRVLNVAAGLMRAHWPGLGLILLCIVLFYQPGQGLRGGMQHLAELPVYLRHVLANLMGVAAGAGSSASVSLMLIEDGIIIALLGWGGFALARRDPMGGHVAGLFLATLALVYLGFCAIGLLTLTPTRHMLFLAPALFLLAGFGIDRLLRPIWPDILSAAVLLLLAAGGLFAQEARYATMREPTPAILASRFSGVVGNDLPFALEARLPQLRIDQWRTQPGLVLYADTDCDEVCLVQRFKTDPHLSNARLIGRVPLGRYGADIKSIAFPAPYDDGRFAFDRWNHLYLMALRIVPR